MKKEEAKRIVGQGLAALTADDQREDVVGDMITAFCPDHVYARHQEGVVYILRDEDHPDYQAGSVVGRFKFSITVEED